MYTNNGRTKPGDNSQRKRGIKCIFYCCYRIPWCCFFLISSCATEYGKSAGEELCFGALLSIRLVFGSVTDRGRGFLFLMDCLRWRLLVCLLFLLSRYQH